MTTYYKFLTKDNLSPFQKFKWSLPNNGEPGEWMPKVKVNLEPCWSGYHSIRSDQPIMPWVDAYIYELEYTELPECNNEQCWGSEARLVRRLFEDTWTEETARLLICRIIEDILPEYRSRYSSDNQLRHIIETVELFARNPHINDYVMKMTNLLEIKNSLRSVERIVICPDVWTAVKDAADDAAWYKASSAIYEMCPEANEEVLWTRAWNTAWAKYESWLWETLLGENSV